MRDWPAQVPVPRNHTSESAEFDPSWQVGPLQARARARTPVCDLADPGASRRKQGPASSRRGKRASSRGARLHESCRRTLDFGERGRHLPPFKPPTCCAVRDPVFDRRQSIIDLAGEYASFRTDVFRDQRSGRDRPSGVRGARHNGHASDTWTACGTSLGAMRAEIRSDVMRAAMQRGWINRKIARPSSSRSARYDERSHPCSIHEP